MKPEARAEIILGQWLKDKSEFIEEIYFNRRNELNWKTFKVRGISRRTPDLIIAINQGFGTKYIAVEVKPSDKSKDILDAKKIIDYYCLYVGGETQYYIDNQEIKIEHFVVATDKSVDGHLFRDETITDGLLDKEKIGKINVINKGYIPRFEGSQTKTFVRGSLWKWFEDIRKEYEIKCGLGILIADIDNFCIPKMQINSYNSDKNTWGQRWWKL